MMNPLRQKKIDISSLSEEEQKLFRLYGKLPTHKSALTKMQKDRKYFDSGDYALSKAGVAPQNAVGTAIPNPENIPHAAPSPSSSSHQNLSVSPTNSTMSPVKESSLAHERSDALEQKSEDVDSSMAAPEVPTEVEDAAEMQDVAEPTAEAVEPAAEPADVGK
ncbi:Endosulfine-domain-containing protein [Athelia psychrophila]|uniref:mRNA stability protein n=1 Tax=Athelia psychrophila TaxID=1759441 RepID=A0A166U8B2_9AGAM|nr:Endosulfine-domain-containing protein [Fibularhizoctonia sp. CBS 109695]